MPYRVLKIMRGTNGIFKGIMVVDENEKQYYTVPTRPKIIIPYDTYESQLLYRSSGNYGIVRSMLYELKKGTLFNCQLQSKYYRLGEIMLENTLKIVETFKHPKLI